MSNDFHGADRVADWLDAPVGYTTMRARFAILARAFLGCADIQQSLDAAGLDKDDVVAHLTGWRAVLLLIVMCSCGGPVLPPKPQSCGYLGDLCSKLAPCCPSVNGAAIECLDGTCERK